MGYSDLEVVAISASSKVTFKLSLWSLSVSLSLPSHHCSVARVTPKGNFLAYLSRQGEQSSSSHVASIWEMSNMVSGPVLNPVDYSG